MSDLVKRLRGGANDLNNGFPVNGERVLCMVQAADRIEQLERDLANTSEAHMLELEWRLKLGRDVQALRAQLAAEKALADRLQDDMFGIEVYASDSLSGPSEGVPDLKWMTDGIEVLHDRAVAARAAYRKARGL